MTELLTGPELPAALPPVPGGSVVTVGTFDGVHRGHVAVLDQVLRIARERGARSVLVTFEPHPLEIVRPAAAPPLLTPGVEKLEILSRSGLDLVVLLPFTHELSQLTADEFVREILVGRLGMTHLVMGHDHGFGRGRGGDAETLRELGRELGFGVDVVPAVHIEGAPVSSTRIRHALLEGEVELAAAALGRPYALTGEVVHGDGRGRKIGYPTANLLIPDRRKLLPREGIYAVRATLEDGLADGVLHLGPRPTFEGASPTVEVHLFDLDRDLYGQRLRVEICGWIRGIVAFDTVEELTRGIADDCAAARRLFAAGGGACQAAGGRLR